jgi:hypothetical protein
MVTVFLLEETPPERGSIGVLIGHQTWDGRILLRRVLITLVIRLFTAWRRLKDGE